MTMHTRPLLPPRSPFATLVRLAHLALLAPLALFLSTERLPAQDAAARGDWFEPAAGWFLCIAAEDVPQLLDGWRTSTLRAAAADPALQPLVESIATEFASTRAAARDETAFALRLGGVLQPDEVLGAALLRVPVDGLRRASLHLYLPGSRPLLVLEPLPSHEGRFAAELLRLQRELARCRGVASVAGDVGALETAAFAATEPPQRVWFVFEARRTQPWLLRRPGQIVVGDGEPRGDGVLVARPEPRATGPGRAAIAMALQPGADALGLDALRTVRCTFGFDAGALVGALELPLRPPAARQAAAPAATGAARRPGLAGALASARGAAPAQPWLPDTVAQARLGLDVDATLGGVDELLVELRLPGVNTFAPMGLLQRTFTGGAAVALRLPRPDAPQLLVSLALRNIGDPDAVVREVASALALQLRTTDGGGLACTTLSRGGRDVAACAVRGATLHVAIPPDGLVALATGDPAASPPPAAAEPGLADGETALPVELVFDPGAAAAMLAAWLPAHAADVPPWLAPVVGAVPADRWPDAASLQRLFGTGRGRLAVRDDSLVWCERSVAAGPVTLTAAASAATLLRFARTFLAANVEPLPRRIARRRLERIGEVLHAAANAREGRFPDDLAALVQRGLLEVSELQWFEERMRYLPRRIPVRLGDGTEVDVIAFERGATGPWLVLATDDAGTSVHEASGDRARRDLAAADR